MLDDAILAQAARLLDLYRARGWRIATAESCTGGLIAAALTHVAGSSDVVDRGFVTYSNAAKAELLGIDPGLIMAHGAVSSPVAAAMAQGALARSSAHGVVAVTGVAGPGGGSVDKPVGTVWFGWAGGGLAAQTKRLVFAGDRRAVRAATVASAFDLLAALASRSTEQ